MLHTAQNGMNEMKPQVDLAYAKYDHSLSHLGPENEKTKNLNEQYQSLKGMYSTHEADAHLGQTQMRSYDAFKQHKSTYSSSRGKV